MREDVEKLVFDTLHEVAKPEFDGFQLRQRVDAILEEHDRTVEYETEAAYDSGLSEGEYSGEWQYQDGYEEGHSVGHDSGYEEGYEAGEAAARAEFEDDSDGASEVS